MTRRRPSLETGVRRSVGVNQGELRRHNLSIVLVHLHHHGPTARADLTAATGLNRSTVASLVADLASRGLLREGEPRSRGTRGRPSPLVRLRTDRVAVLAIEISVDSLAAATVAMGGQILSASRVARSRERSSPEQIITDAVALADPLLAQLPRGQRLVGVGVSIAGVVRSGDGFVHVAPNLEWRSVPLAERVTAALDRRVPVLVGNDADLGALAEQSHGAGSGSGNLIYLFGEVGVGAGVIIDGRPLRGAAGYGGEVGHMVVNPDGIACRCGSRGCWETEAGEEALLRHAGSLDLAGRDAVERVLADAAAGKPEALRALDRVGYWLGVGVASLVNIFNPERVILGGLFGRLHPYVHGVIRAALDRHALTPARDQVEVIPSALRVDSPLLGAAELALSGTLADPTAIPRLRSRRTPPVGPNGMRSQVETDPTPALSSGSSHLGQERSFYRDPVLSSHHAGRSEEPVTGWGRVSTPSPSGRDPRWSMVTRTPGACRAAGGLSSSWSSPA
jgi:predicted NBD/HSP70 family sugar kinase